MNFKKEPFDMPDFSNIVPLFAYAESIGANPAVLKRQAARYGALINRGGVNFIDLNAFDAGQADEADRKRKAKVQKKAEGSGPAGSVETTNSTGLLRGLINKLSKSIPVKERELADLETEYNRAPNQVVKSALSRRYDRLEPELRKNKKTLALAEKRLNELAEEDCKKFEDAMKRGKKNASPAVDPKEK